MLEGTVEILVVEDDESHAELIRRSFEVSHLSCSVTIAKNLAEARADLAVNSPDLVIIDYRLPDGLGTELLPRDGREQHFAVVLMTCCGSQRLAVDALKAGASDYIEKSAESIRRLPDTVKRVLREWNETLKRRLAEKALSESESRLKTITDSAIDAILMIDSEGKVSFWNPAAENILGYTSAEAMGKNLHALIAPQRYHEAHHKAFYEFVRTGQGAAIGKTLELEAIRKDGSEISISLSLSAVRVNENWHAVGIVRDITDIKKAAIAHRDSNEKFRTLFECSRDALMTIAPPLWKFTSCNGACVEMFRAKDEAELARLGPWDVSPPYQPDGKTSVDKAKSMIETAIREGSHYFEWTHKRLNGENFPTTVLLTRMEMNGEMVIQATVRDETVRNKREHDLAGLAAIVKQTNELIIVANPSWMIEYVNPAFENLTGFRAPEITGQDARILFTGDKRRDVIQAIEQALVKGEAWTGRVQTKKIDGTVFTQEASIWPIRESSGEIICLVSIGHDITQQLMFARQLSQAQKLESIGQLAAGIAHEINTPMQYVGDNTHFIKDSFTNIMELVRKQTETFTALKEGCLTEELTREVEKAIEKADLEYIAEEIPKAIEQSLDGIERVSKIVRAMKEFSHPGVEGKVAADLNKAIQSTITVSRNEWKYVAEMTTDFDPTLTLVPCYPGELNQAILNLITNAAHAIKMQQGENPSRKGLITISTRLDGNWVEIVIADTGSGIPENIRERIFDPFFTTKDVGKGTGQGLAICHSVIVEKHKGTITFDSEVGIGTSFVIRLPISDDRTLVEPALEAGSRAEV